MASQKFTHNCFVDELIELHLQSVASNSVSVLAAVDSRICWKSLKALSKSRSEAATTKGRIWCVHITTHQFGLIENEEQRSALAFNHIRDTCTGRLRYYGVSSIPSTVSVISALPITRFSLP